MSEEQNYIALIILYLPTALFGIAVLWGILRGFMRGARKSVVLLVNMFIALAVSFAFVMIIGIDTLYVTAGEVVPSGTLPFEGETFQDVIFDLLNQSGFSFTMTSVEALSVYIEMILNLVLFFIALLIVYPIVKFILYIVYLIIFRSGIKEKNSDYGKKRLLGAGIGLIRGAVLGFLIFSQFSTLYCILAGGQFYSEEEYQSITIDGKVWEYDEYYKALKTSRDFGLGSFFDSIAGENGTALDYLLLDVVASSSYQDLAGNKVTVTLREELTGFTSIAASLIDNGIISFESGGIVFNQENINSEIIENICHELSDIKLITDVIPTVIFDLLQENFDMEFSDEMINGLDLSQDFVIVANIISDVLSLIDLDSMSLVAGLTWDGIDPELVDSIIDSMSKLTFITKVALPLGSSMASELVDGLVFDFSNILWEEELQNLKGLYSLLIKLPINGLIDGELEIIEGFLADEEVMLVVDEILQQVFNSDLVYSIVMTGVEYALANLLSENEMFNGVDVDFTDYSKDYLKEDISTITSCIINGYELFEMFTSEDFGNDFFAMDITPVRRILVGYTNEESEDIPGLFDLKLIVCLDINTLISNALSSSLDGVLELPVIDDWKQEITYLLDAVESIQTSGLDLDGLMDGDFGSLSNMSDESIETFKSSVVQSKIISSLLVTTFSSMEGLDVPDGIEWYGEDGELNAILTAVFHIVKLDILDELLSGDISTILGSLTEQDVSVLLKSVIMHSTISNLLVSMEGELLTIPADAYDGNYISKTEILALVKIVLQNADILTDFDSVKILSDENITLFSQSIIISRTLVAQLEGGLSLSIPNLGENWYNENDELTKLLKSLQAILGADTTIGGLSEFGDFDLNVILSNSSTILDSSVLLIIISEMFINLELLDIPNSVITTLYGENIIDKTELTTLFGILSDLGLSDFESFDVSVFFGEDVVYSELLASVILSATLSNIVIEASKGETPLIIIPEDVYDLDGNIESSELIALLEGLRDLGFTDMSGNISLESLLTDESLITSVITSSTILHATISNIILSSGIDIVTEYDGVAIITKGVLTTTEISALINSLNILGLDFSDLNIGLQMLTDNKENLEEILESSIIATIISEVLILNAASIPGLSLDTYDQALYGDGTVEIISKENIIVYVELLA